VATQIWQLPTRSRISLLWAMSNRFASIHRCTTLRSDVVIFMIPLTWRLGPDAKHNDVGRAV
jgi:hypothetical protein